MDESKEPGIKISQIYLGQAHFGHIENALALPPNTPIKDIPTQIGVQVGVNSSDKVGFCVLSIRSDPEVKESLYQFHVEMVLVVGETPDPNMPLPEYLTRSGPPTLYPFIREVVASMSSKGRFGTLWLPPINFAAISEKLLKEQTAKATASTSTE